MKSDPTAYYATVAQVLPVLGFFIMFEVRALGDWRAWWDRGGTADARTIPVPYALFGFAMGSLFFLGELAALNAVKEGKPSGYEEAIVPFALYMYLFAVVLYPIQMHAEALIDRLPGVRRGRLWLWRRFG